MNFKTLYNLNLSLVNIGGKVKFFLRLPSYGKTQKLLQRNEKLINSREHDTIYICGMGPSLADIDWDNLIHTQADTLVVNSFVKMAETTKLIPTYYLMADAAFVGSRLRPILERAVKVYPNSKFIWNSTLPFLDSSLLDYACDKYFLAMYNGYYNAPKTINIKKVMPAFGNCICAAIAFAIGVGYKRIIQNMFEDMFKYCKFRFFTFYNK